MTEKTSPPFSAAGLLLAASRLYAAAVRTRSGLYAAGRLTTARLSCPVVAVGNLTAGGTGKTPMTVHLAGLARDLGFRPAIVSRGYKGRYRDPAMIVGDGRGEAAEGRIAGDEPALMASLLPDVPVIVARDRRVGGQMAIERFRPDFLLLDDAFQHLKLHRDLNLLLLDAVEPFGNFHLLPRGMLREPIEALFRADAVILTRCAQAPPYLHRLARLVHPRPVYQARHAPVLRCIIAAGKTLKPGALRHATGGLPADSIQSRRLFAFSGLARNGAFLASIRTLRADLAGWMDYEDHFAYSFRDLGTISDAARRAGADGLITTDKDFVRLPRDFRFSLPLLVLGVEMVVPGQQGWRSFLADRLRSLIRGGHQDHMTARPL